MIEWVVCPTRINGQDRNCSLGADIVSNSWGSQDPRDDFYKPYVEVWREAGQIPVFANGNTGPHCGALGAPGRTFFHLHRLFERSIIFFIRYLKATFEMLLALVRQTLIMCWQNSVPVVQVLM